MPELIAAAASILALTFVVGLLPLLRARQSTDRMLAAQLLGTNGVGLLLLLAPLLNLAALVDVALVLALLAAVALIAFTRRARGDDHA